MKVFNVNDIVRCSYDKLDNDVSISNLDSLIQQGFLSMDTNYVVRSYKEKLAVSSGDIGDRDGYVSIKDDMGDVDWYATGYFISLKEIRMNKLNKLKQYEN